jgi:hypothetical protein
MIRAAGIHQGARAGSQALTLTGPSSTVNRTGFNLKRFFYTAAVNHRNLHYTLASAQPSHASADIISVNTVIHKSRRKRWVDVSGCFHSVQKRIKTEEYDLMVTGS